MSRNQNQTDPVVFSTEPTIPLAKCTNAYHFAKSSKSVLQLQSKRKDFTDYYIPAGDVVNITKMKSKDTTENNGVHLRNLRIFNLEFGK